MHRDEDEGKWDGDRYWPHHRLVREVAGYDPTRYADVARRDLREVLLAYEAAERVRAVASYRHYQLMYAFNALDKPPQLPDWLLTAD